MVNLVNCVAVFDCWLVNSLVVGGCVHGFACFHWLLVSCFLYLLCFALLRLCCVLWLSVSLGFAFVLLFVMFEFTASFFGFGLWSLCVFIVNLRLFC